MRTINWQELIETGSVPEWPYPIHYGAEKEVSTDILVLGGGIAGCWAAISAASKGLKVTIVEKGCTIRSGAGGVGCDHWLYTANPLSKIAPEEMVVYLVNTFETIKAFFKRPKPEVKGTEKKAVEPAEPKAAETPEKKLARTKISIKGSGPVL